MTTSILKSINYSVFLKVNKKWLCFSSEYECGIILPNSTILYECGYKILLPSYNFI